MAYVAMTIDELQAEIDAEPMGGTVRKTTVERLNNLRDFCSNGDNPVNVSEPDTKGRNGDTINPRSVYSAYVNLVDKYDIDDVEVLFLKSSGKTVLRRPVA